MELGLTGKTVVVTGGSSHIGRGIVLAFAKERSNIVIADIDEVQAQKTAELARKLGGKVLVIRTDVTEAEQCEAMVKKTLDELGRLDVLVNNVGWLREGMFIEKPREEWLKEVDICFWGTVNCIRAVINHMVAQESGRIVNMASAAGKVGQYRQAIYSATKGAVIALSKALAQECGRYGININAVCPGMVLPIGAEDIGERSMWRGGAEVMGRAFEEMTSEIKEKMAKAYPLRRLGKAEDVASLVVFLASDAASWITGQAISVDGGITMT